MTTRGTPAIETVRQAGVPHVVHEYELPRAAGRDGGPGYGEAAAAALGVEPARLFKTLIVTAGGRLAMAIVPVSAELDLKAIAAVLGVRAASMADPAVAERSAGSVVGGISPLGARRPMPAVLDASALEHTTIYVSAGRRGVQLELAPADLVRLAAARVDEIRRR